MVKSLGQVRKIDTHLAHDVGVALGGLRFTSPFVVVHGQRDFIIEQKTLREVLGVDAMARL